jgi:hypothetical protein
LVKFISQSQCRLLPQHFPYDQDKIEAPRVMMTLTAVSAEPGLPQLSSWPVVRTHDMRQFMQACVFAFTDCMSVVRADLDPAQKGVGVASSLSAHHGYRSSMGRESRPKPFYLLDGTDVSHAVPICYYAIIHD